MTSNQLNYWQNVERERSNRANEALTAEQNKIGWDKQRQKDLELIMSNLQNYLEYGKRGDLQSMTGVGSKDLYGSIKGGWGNSTVNEFDRDTWGSVQGITELLGQTIGGIIPGITLKI